MRKSKGTKDHLLVDKLVMFLTKRNHRNLIMMWIDYRKAYDSVPHTQWYSKALHGWWPGLLLKRNVQSSAWLRKAYLNPVTEALIMAAHFMY